MQPTEISVPLNFGTHMIGDHETPPHADSQAQGQVIFQFNRDRTEVSYRLIASNIDNPFASHIHMGKPGSAGPIVLGLFSGPTGIGRHDGVLATGTKTALNLSGPLSGKTLSDLLELIEKGEAYVNVHTNDGADPHGTHAGDYPLGEIRGQLVK